MMNFLRIHQSIMNYYHSTHSWIITVITVLALLPGWTIYAEAQECRKAIVLYLDVSGSMFYDSNDLETDDGSGEEIKLMTAIAGMYKDLFTGPDRIIADGDFFAVKGFYSCTGNLINPIRRYRHDQHNSSVEALAREIQNSAIQNDNRFRDEAIGGQTNFVSLLKDMDRMASNIADALTYNQLIFIVLSDGYDDVAGHTEQVLVEALENSMLSSPDSRTQLNSLVLFFTIGDRDALAGVQMAPLMERYLGAETYLIEHHLKQFNDMREVIDRSAVSPLPRVEEFSGPKFPKLRNPEEYEFSLKLVNIGCNPLSLQGIDYRIIKGDQILKDGFESKIPALNFSRVGDKWSALETSISFPRDMVSPGTYKIQFFPGSQHGEIVSARTFDLKIPVIPDLSLSKQVKYSDALSSYDFSLLATNKTPEDIVLTKIEWRLHAYANAPPDVSDIQEDCAEKAEGVFLLAEPLALPRGDSLVQDKEILFSLEQRLDSGWYLLELIPFTGKGDSGATLGISFQVVPTLTADSVQEVRVGGGRKAFEVAVANHTDANQSLKELEWEVVGSGGKVLASGPLKDPDNTTITGKTDDQKGSHSFIIELKGRLEPGEYTFEVAALNQDGVLGAPTTKTFKVVQNFIPIFIMILIGIFVGIIYIILK